MGSLPPADTSAPLTTPVNEGVEGLPRADPGVPAPPADRTTRLSSPAPGLSSD
jgi:hypothetical protein